MLRKAYTPASMFLEALALLVIGILFFTNPERTLALAISIIHILAWIAALNNLFKWLTKRDEHRPSLFHALLMLVLAIFLSTHHSLIAPSASASYDIDIEPDDIEVCDTVTIVWVGNRLITYAGYAGEVQE